MGGASSSAQAAQASDASAGSVVDSQMPSPQGPAVTLAPPTPIRSKRTLEDEDDDRAHKYRQIDNMSASLQCKGCSERFESKNMLFRQLRKSQFPSKARARSEGAKSRVQTNRSCGGQL